ncbi:ABC transporter ATP-binding protein [Actinoplanes sp. RD1]|uniref:ABC transporter ATP-binding protein n=1 Tax=Actinoplanes sp. RD1 TaxID=3064538 RepID=UPI0027412890|nr:ATP-binding cassette domain-containing protein [Actinoplanes sp. RD1]
MPVLHAAGAGVKHRRRWLFRDLDVDVEPGEVAAVVGPPGSGRTTVLLALAQRFKLDAGRVDVTGRVALGHVPGVSEPEPVLTVAEHVRERFLLSGRKPAEVDLRDLRAEAKGFELSPYEKQVLGLILAGIAEPDLIALDGVDDGLDAPERAALWELIGQLSAAVIVTAREIDVDVATVVRLGGAQ